MTTAPAVVVLHAHPDDEAIFTGATIRNLADAGVRVTVVTATGGEAGAPRVPLRPGETMRDRRTAELERACELLGVSRLVLLGYGDSGAHAGPYPRGSLGAAPARDIARRVERIVEEEAAGCLIHYDPRGIYGHVDHVQVHRAGARVVRRLAITGYEATVDAAVLRDGPRHVLQQVAGAHVDAGVDARDICLTVRAGIPALLAKMAAMAAHASQIGPEYLDPLDFAAGYGQEWFVRRGAPGILDAQSGPAGGQTSAPPPAQVVPAAAAAGVGG